jgi:alpha-glucuronidase
MIGGMRVHHVAARLLLGFLFITPFAYGETGEEGWLRYAPLPQPAAQQYSNIPHLIVAPGQSPPAHSAANELSRGLHSMLGADIRVSANISAAGDVFVVGTAAEIEKLIPGWKSASPIPAEGFEFSRLAADGRNYWIVAGGSDRGELYGIFHILAQVGQQKPLAGASFSTRATCGGIFIGYRSTGGCWPQSASTG